MKEQMNSIFLMKELSSMSSIEFLISFIIINKNNVEKFNKSIDMESRILYEPFSPILFFNWLFLKHSCKESIHGLLVFIFFFFIVDDFDRSLSTGLRSFELHYFPGSSKSKSN